MKIKILIILLLNLIFLNSIVYSQSVINYYVANNGTDGNYCGQAISQACATPVGAVTAFRYRFGYYSSDSYQLVVNFGSPYQWLGGNPLNLYNLNVSFVGSPDGSTYFYNPYSNFPLFNVTDTTEQTAVTFTNINYGSPSYGCYHNYQYNSLDASLLLIVPSSYSSVKTYVLFNNLTLSCKTIDIPIVVVNGYNNLGSVSEDYNDYFYGSISYYQPNVFITFNAIYFNQSAMASFTRNTPFSFSSQLVNAPYMPTSVSIVNSVMVISDANFLSTESFINVGRGNLIIDNSTFSISTLTTNAPYFVTTSSTQVDITNSTILISGYMGNFLSCQGCFFKADNLNFTSLSIASSPVPFSFIYASASFYNSLLISAQYGGIISSYDSQLALRSNVIISKDSNSISLDKTNAFIFGNTFSSYYDVGTLYFFSSSTPIYCSPESESDIVGDYSVGGYTENCSKYTKDFKLKWYFGFLAVGIVGTLFIYIFLASTIAIIKRCGGGDS
ncbi:hypothetical protein ACTFIV_004114 [Dictyostelium citrinum]